jgi:hypothetical protein
MGGFPEIPDDSVDLVVTSPPYKKKDGYSRALMLSLGKGLGRVLKPGGLVVFNFAQLVEDMARPFEARSAICEGSKLPKNLSPQRLHTGQTVIWVKSIAVPSWRELVEEATSRFSNVLGQGSAIACVDAIKTYLRQLLAGPGRSLVRGHSQPINSDYLLYYNWEFLFTFHKAPRPKVDRLAIGVEYADKGNLKRGTRGKHGDVRCAGDTWFIPYETTGATKKKKHVYEYPAELVRRCVKLAGAGPGSTIFEPFLGSGQTVVVAKEMGLNAYATEIDARTLKAAKGRHAETAVLTEEGKGEGD